jgi:hypothetical protein
MPCLLSFLSPGTPHVSPDSRRKCFYKESGNHFFAFAAVLVLALAGAFFTAAFAAGLAFAAVLALAGAFFTAAFAAGLAFAAVLALAGAFFAAFAAGLAFAAVLALTGAFFAAFAAGFAFAAVAIRASSFLNMRFRLAEPGLPAPSCVRNRLLLQGASCMNFPNGFVMQPHDDCPGIPLFPIRAFFIELNLVLKKKPVIP